jgi:hypothetical protein
MMVVFLNKKTYFISLSLSLAKKNKLCIVVRNSEIEALVKRYVNINASHVFLLYFIHILFQIEL